VVSKFFVGPKKRRCFFSFIGILREKKGQQNSDQFLKIYVINLKKLVIYLVSSHKNTKFKKKGDSNRVWEVKVLLIRRSIVLGFVPITSAKIAGKISFLF
jgi:hypothetical protein